MCTHVCLSVCIFMYTGVQYQHRPGEGAIPPGARVIDFFELPNMGDGN